MDRVVSIYDEGLVLAGGWRVYLGDWPHRDFYANYGPGQFFTLAWLFKVFGVKVLVERIYDLILRVLIVFVAYLSLSRYCSPRPALFGAFLIALYLLGIGYHGYPVFPAILLALVALFLLLEHTDNAQATPTLLGGGLFAGFAALYRYDMGFFAYTSLAVALYSSNALTAKNWFVDRLSLTKLILLSLGAFIPVATILILHWTQGALSGFVHDVIYFPAKHYAATRSLPFPRLVIGRISGINIDVYLPILLFVLAVIQLRVVFNEGGSKSQTGLGLPKGNTVFISLAMLTLFFYFKGVVRPNVVHLIGSIIPAIMLAVVLLEYSRNSIVKSGSVVALLLFLTCGMNIAFGKLSGEPFFEGFIQQLNAKLTFFKPAESMEYEDDSGKYFKVGDYQREAALKFIKAHSVPMDFFYSGLRVHDKVFLNDNAVYFLLGLRPATKWHHFDPALQNSRPIQLEIIRDLTRNKPVLMMLDASYEYVKEPNESAKHSGVKDLDVFIENNYIPVKHFGAISVWQRLDK